MSIYLIELILPDGQTIYLDEWFVTRKQALDYMAEKAGPEILHFRLIVFSRRGATEYDIGEAS